ncbi:MAG: hypothetical protein ABIR62_03370 [Dokdonella sp.]|uniref:hypothetical protein n=1 Tax=Dokdonella sp. TaxID=2291710 RepID=UPI00326797D4
MDHNLADEARRMFQTRHPLEIFEDESWRPLEDTSVCATVFELPVARAMDVSGGVRLPDGRVVRFRVPRHRMFDEVEFVRTDHGQIDGATAHCATCGAYRLLQVTLFSGGHSLRCAFCSAWETEELVRGKPL